MVKKKTMEKSFINVITVMTIATHHSQHHHYHYDYFNGKNLAAILDNETFFCVGNTLHSKKYTYTNMMNWSLTRNIVIVKTPASPGFTVGTNRS